MICETITRYFGVENPCSLGNLFPGQETFSPGLCGSAILARRGRAGRHGMIRTSSDEKDMKDAPDVPLTAMETGPGPVRLSPFGRLVRTFALWFGFTGLYAAFAVCPFCGRQGCPVGMVSAGTVGAFFALCFQDWKRLVVFIRTKRRADRRDKKRGG
jgi:hypothetical protein